MGAPRLIVDQGELNRVALDLAEAPVYAVDTEFHRERTYWPQLGLVQLSWDGQVALADPTRVDLRPLGPALQGSGVAVMHAAVQDLEVLDRACAALPTKLFDTQLAAGFLGYSSPSLSSLLDGEIGVRLPKGDRLTDWLRRPLAEDQLQYAAADVAHLVALYEHMTADLATQGRLAWAWNECEELLARARREIDPDSAWLRLKEARRLRGASRGVVRSVAAWRERRAAEVDQPVRFVLPDLALLSIAQRPPRTIEQLRRVRGIEERHLRGDAGRAILAAVEEGAAAPVDERDEAREPDAELDRELRPAVSLVSAWVSQIARDCRIDTSLLATRADLVALLRGDADARLTRGWRAELVGEPVRRLVEGRAALAFDGHGRLLLEPRSPLSRGDSAE